MKLLEFAGQPIAPTPATTLAEQTPAPQPEPAPAPPFVHGQTYTLAGDDVYRAFRRQNVWLLQNLNRSWQGHDLGFFSGFILKGGVLYACEYGWERGKRQWSSPPSPAGRAPDDFQPCAVETKIISMGAWK